MSRARACARAPRHPTHDHSELAPGAPAPPHTQTPTSTPTPAPAPIAGRRRWRRHRLLHAGRRQVRPALKCDTHRPVAPPAGQGQGQARAQRGYHHGGARRRGGGPGRLAGGARLAGPRKVHGASRPAAGSTTALHNAPASRAASLNSRHIYCCRPRPIATVPPTQRASAPPAIRQGDAEALPFAADSFDRYVSAGSIEYWPDPQRGICEAYRCAAGRPASGGGGVLRLNLCSRGACYQTVPPSTWLSSSLCHRLPGSSSFQGDQA
jgi:hypothetical protein